MTPRVSDIIEIINIIAPFSYAEEWDNVGLQIGDPTAPVSKIIVSLDAGEDAIEAAITGQCQLLLTHHPLIFHPLKKVNILDPPCNLLSKALRNNLNIVSLHTNFDIAPGGVNDMLAERLGINSALPLVVTRVDELVKLAVFVPKGHEEQVLQALFRFSGFIGNYTECSFQSEGIGTFKPLSGAAPFIGSVGMREHVEEIRIEVLLRKEDMKGALEAMFAVHPYEEAAVDLYPLLNEGKCLGLGRIGELEEMVSLEQFASRLKKEFTLDGVKYVGRGESALKKIALCGGSGSSLIPEAHRQGADVLVTGDVKYHEACEARSLGLALIDIGHFASEFIMVEGLAGRMKKELIKRGFAAEIIGCRSERDPFCWI